MEEAKKYLCKTVRYSTDPSRYNVVKKWLENNKIHYEENGNYVPNIEYELTLYQVAQLVQYIKNIGILPDYVSDLTIG